MKRPRFIPPPPDPPPPVEPQLQLYELPQDQILLHGEMIRGAQTIDAILQGLPFDQKAYRGSLRVLISCCKQMEHRCLLLLGEAPEQEPPDAPDLVDDPGLRGPITVTNARIEVGRASNKIDEPAAGSNRTDKPRRQRTANGSGGRTKPAAPAGEPAPEPSGRKAEILAELRKKPMTSADLIKELRATPSAIYSVLTILRDQKAIESRIDDSDGQRKNFLR